MLVCLVVCMSMFGRITPELIMNHSILHSQGGAAIDRVIQEEAIYC